MNSFLKKSAIHKKKLFQVFNRRIKRIHWKYPDKSFLEGESTAKIPLHPAQSLHLHNRWLIAIPLLLLLNCKFSARFHSAE